MWVNLDLTPKRHRLCGIFLFCITIKIKYKDLNYKALNFFNIWRCICCVVEQVYKRLKLTLELVKKEMEICKIQVLMHLDFMCVALNYYSSFIYWSLCELLQETIAKAIEEKISGEQRRYLLNEQLKAIKKVNILHDLVW